ncbi:hypothetical protein [Neorhizobium sp. NCHU2750]|uniref:hypothetical protein n=1 Tax=Neorhizobium sp. NCHU2750 TaxID=1825976 RepID=UPI000E74109F|nr:hypothetical protein NCHU2750_15490 [Neorhizobium sp. NCHU2750]
MDATDAIMQQLRERDVTADKPINLYEIGPTLVGAGYSEGEIVNALFYLQSMKRIELMDGNRVRLITSQTSQ